MRTVLSALPGMLETVRSQVVSPVLVGRSVELGRLDHAFAAALAGSSRAVLIGGEAGVGKSRLISEFAERAAAAGARTLVGGCVELGADGLPYAPFTAVLRQLVREIGIEGIGELLPGSPVGLARLVPEFDEPGPDGSTSEARARLFELTLTLLERLAARDPLVVVIEDAHWADRSTRDLLTFLVRNLGGTGSVLLAVTYRSDELHREHPMRRLLAELDRVDRVERHELPRLSRSEVYDLLRHLLGREPELEQVNEAFQRSAGNPLFVEALLDDDGTIARDLPESLRDLLVAGVHRLPEETQDLLRVASGSGAHIEHRLLAAVSGLDEGTLARTLRPAVAANILAVDGDAYTFRHALIREAIHEDLLPGEHTRLHARYAEAIESDSSLVPAGRSAVEQAYHWYSAHDATWALISAWQATDDARRAVGYAEALRMVSRVLELWDKVPDAAERIGAGHAEVLERALIMADNAGESERGTKLATAALKEIDDPTARARVLERRGVLAIRLGRATGLEDLREASRIAPAVPPTSERARVLATLAEHLYKRSPAPEARAAAEEALATARAADDAIAESMSLLTLSSIEYRSAPDLDRRLAGLAEARAVAERADVYRPILRAAVQESDVLEGWGRHEQAAEVARDGIAGAERYGLGRVTGSILAINLADPLVSLGRWDEALTVVEHALEQNPLLHQRCHLYQMTGHVALARGDLDFAASALAKASEAAAKGPLAVAEQLFPVVRLDAELRMARGDHTGAIAEIEEVLGDPEPPADPRYTWPLFAACATACAETGDTDALDRLRAQAGKHVIAGPVQRAYHLTFLAETARAEGSLDRDAWAAAVAAWEALRQPYGLAKALLRAAEADAADGAKDLAIERLRHAAELADALGARPLREQIDVLSRRVGAPDGADPDPRLGLTPRELEVLRHLAEGHSNREIAAALFISAKTASVHVSNILAKLGVATRGEAAATAHRLGLFTEVQGSSR
jgi:DNA-binding CsgD family transcriptional regulator